MKQNKTSVISVKAQENIRVFAFFLLLVAVLCAALISVRKTAGTVTYYFYGGQLIYGNNTIFRIAPIVSSATSMSFNFWGFLMWVLLPLGAGIVGLVKFKSFKQQMAICLGLTVAALALLCFVPYLIAGGTCIPWLGLWIAYPVEALALVLYAIGFFRSLKGYEKNEK